MEEQVQYQELPIVKEKTDRISSLPDSLLQHILSFLKVTDAINSSLLSKSWRYLWTAISCLNFTNSEWQRKTRKATFINRILYNHNAPKVRKLRIQCCLGCRDYEKLESWIRFALKHDVEKFELDLSSEHYACGHRSLKLPQSLYESSSVSSLTLCFCQLNMPLSIHLISLKKLCLQQMYLSAEIIIFITTNCPILEHLVLCYCNKHADLDITITNQNLKVLTIIDDYNVELMHEVMICAPYLVELNLWVVLRREYCLKKLGSLERVALCDLLPEGDQVRVYGVLDANDVSVEILRDLCHVGELIICMYLVQVMSIRGVHRFLPLDLSTTYLDLDTEFSKWELPGISYLLQSCPHLRTLRIQFPDSIETLKLYKHFKKRFAFKEKGFWNSEECKFPSGLQNLESVQIGLLSGTHEYGEAEDDLKTLKNVVEFAQFLLKNSNGLKKMVIKCGQCIKLNHALLFKLTNEVIAFPRASPDATVDIV